MRVYFGGFKSTVIEEDIITRFQSFGVVSDVSIPKGMFLILISLFIIQDSNGECRGFAHFTLNLIDASQWKRILSAYNGSSWRGGKIRLEESKRLANGILFGKMDECNVVNDCCTDLGIKSDDPQGQARQLPCTQFKHYSHQENGGKRIRRRIRHSSNLDLVKDPSPSGEAPRGWKKARYGRAVMLVHVRRPDGRIITVDPDHYKDRFEKLFGSVRPKPLSQLTWRYENDPSKQFLESFSSDSSSEEEYAEIVESIEKKNAIESCKQVGAEKLSIDDIVEPKFSLSKLLGLEPVSASFGEKPSLITDGLILDQTIAKPPRNLLKPSDVLFPILLVDEITASDGALCRRCGEEESIALWSNSRAVLRAELKSRLRLLARRKAGSKDH